jgi:HSP20 family molecular chaperone IbpA
MFKKKCPKCENKINKNFDFCPYCGFNPKSKDDREDYGFLGKNDIVEENLNGIGLGTPFMQQILNQTMKIFENQIKKMSEDIKIKNKIERVQPNFPIRNNIQLFINGKRIFPEENLNREKQVQIQKVKVNQISKEKLERLSKFPKKEPVSKVRRLGTKVVYELEVPGVNDINDVLVNRLENSIEIKALSDDLVYSKILNVNLPILRYGLDNGNLILELQGR